MDACSAAEVDSLTFGEVQNEAGIIVMKWIRGQSTAVLISIALHLLIAVLASVCCL